MTIGIGAHVKATGSAAVSVTTSSRTTQASGSTFYVAIHDPNTDVTVSDSEGNTYSQIGSTGSTNKIQLWTCQNGVGGAGHIWTVTWNSGTADPVVFGGEITGATAESFDATAQAYDDASPYSVTSPTLSQASELALCLLGTNGAPGGWNAGSGFSVIDSEVDANLYWTAAIGYKVVSAIDPVTASWTTDSGIPSADLIIATFKESTVGSSGDASGAGSIVSSSAADATVSAAGAQASPARRRQRTQTHRVAGRPSGAHRALRLWRRVLQRRAA